MRTLLVLSRSSADRDRKDIQVLIATCRQPIEFPACIGGTPHFWLGLPWGRPGNEVIVVRSLGPRHRRKCVMFCRLNRVKSDMLNGEELSVRRCSEPVPRQSATMRERIRDHSPSCREQQPLEVLGQ